ncbi:hypothetical protein R6Q59_009935 [Mikania micrantha]
MFGIIADLIASVVSILLPAYLSYKSLRTADPAQTTPWLIYFIMLSLTLFFESWTVFILGWFPFYSWFRLFFLLYLVLPQTQGAKILYLQYVEPYIVSHEKNIDHFIGEAHDRLESMGLSYLSVVVEWIREKVLGQASPQPTKPAAGAAGYGAAASYASDLLSRFAMPAARTNAAQATGLTSLLSAALTSTSSATATRSDPSAHGHADISVLQSLLNNPNTSNADKSFAIQSQRDRLNTLMKMLDKEQQSLDLAYGSGSGGSRGGFPKSVSQQSFERVDYDDVAGGMHTPGSSQHSTPPKPSSGKRTTSGGFMSGWLGGDAQQEVRRDDGDDIVSKGWSAARDMTETIMGSGSDTRYRRH